MKQGLYCRPTVMYSRGYSTNFSRPGNLAPDICSPLPYTLFQNKHSESPAIRHKKLEQVNLRFFTNQQAHINTGHMVVS